MPPKRKNPSALSSAIRPRGSKVARSLTAPPVAPAPLASDYRGFLNDFVVNKAPANFPQAAVDQWPEPPATSQGQIVNDIARKFKNTNRLGIAKVNPAHRQSLASYWMDMSSAPGEASLDLQPNPNPTTLGHELVHANDHQYDNLNAKIWPHLEKLHTENDNNSEAFSNSINKIRDKIDPTKTFSSQYKKDLSRGAVVKEINDWRYTQSLGKFTPPKQNAKGDNWGSTFQEIPQVVTHPDPTNNGLQNRPFFLGGPSEFPAFMSENLTRHWGVRKGPNPLSLPEARFLHSTLGDMEAAYPAAEYPTMNNYIGQRRNSLEHAYYPGAPANGEGPAIPAGPPEGGFSRGGRVTGKNLLSRFKKTH